jgi:glycosyltransferase involved in cell wall biosynthesis
MTEAVQPRQAQQVRPAGGFPRKVLLLTGYLWGGGAEWHALNLACTLRDKLGVQVDVGYVLAGSADALQTWRRWNFQPQRVASLRGLWRVSRGGYDVVHAHLFKGELAGVFASIAAGTPLILTRHSLDWSNLPLWQRMILRQVVRRRARGIIAVSDAVGQITEKSLAGRNVPIRVIHHGLDVGLLRSRLRGSDIRKELGLEGKFLLGTAARLSPDKGLTYLLEAFAQAASALADWHIVIAGDGPQRSILQKLAARLGISDRVHILGWRDDALDIVAGLDLFVLPSIREGFGLALLEAMILGVPSLASGLPSIRETAGAAVLYFPPADAHNLGLALRQLAGHPELRRSLAEFGMRRAKEFSALEMATQTLAFYREVAQAANETAPPPAR